MSIQEQNNELQTPDSFLLPPSVSDTENDVLNYNNLTTSPVVQVPPWIGINSQSKLWLHCECTYADGRAGIIELAEAVPVKNATGTSIFTCELPLDELARLGDNTNLAIILMVSNDGTMEKQSLSSIRYNLMFQHPIALINYSRWMTDIGTSLEHLRIRDLILPLAHNAGIDQEGAGWPADWWAACQDDSFAYQLNGGIRALDLRLHGRRFEHGGYHASRYLSECRDAVSHFAEQNPGEIVILGFHKVFVDDEAYALNELLFRLRDRCIPADAEDLTIKQIRSRHPGKNVIIAWDFPNPLCWSKINQKWTGDTENTDGEISRYMDQVWGQPLPNQLWSMFACGYDLLSGPVRYDSSAIFWDKFFKPVTSSNYRKPTRGNMIQIDFFAGTGVVDRCIHATRDRASNAARSVASHLYINLIGTRDVELEWQSPTDTAALNGYDILQNGTFLATLPSHPRKHSITGLADGRTYYFQVVANFTDGTGAVAEAKIAIPDITSPSRPYNLRIKTYDFTNPTISYLSWEKSFDNVALRHYEVYRNDEPTPIGTTTHTFLQINETTGVTYVVRAVDTSGNRSDSDPLAAIGDQIPPTKPANFAATATNTNSVTLTWDPSSDNVAVAGYQIIRNTTPIGTINSNVFSETVLDGTYTYKVRALDTSGNSTDSDELRFRIGRPLPSRPTNLRAANLGGKTYIAWDGSTSNDGLFYEIWRNGVPVGKVNHYSGTLSFMTEDVVTPWYIMVRARDIAGNFADSEIVRDDTIAPSKPTNLRHTAITGNSVTLEWTASSDNVAVTGYHIFLNSDPFDTTNNTRYTVSGLTSATPYTFKVRALDAAGNFADSDPLPVKTPDTSGPSKPTNLQAVALRGNHAILEWNASSDNVAVTGYQIFRNNDPLDTINNTMYLALGLTEATPYIFKVRALDAEGNFADSDELPVTTPDETAPSKPLNFRPTAITGNSITMEWDASSDNVAVAGYQIFLNLSSEPVATTNNTRYTFSGLTNASYYFPKVRALDAAGNFTDSDPQIVKTL